MYAQFRTQYPMGSLTAELLQIHEGKFIVRASVAVGGTTLATGLSAATTIEQAEDQARVRALVVLGIEGHPYPTHAHIVSPELDATTDRNAARLGVAASPADFLPLPEEAFQNSLDGNWMPAPARASSIPEQQLSWFDTPLDPDRLASPASPAMPPTPQRPQTMSQREVPLPRTQPSPKTPGPPTDLSDIIAQTDVELKRLGWTSAQGRRHLEKTYSKRSRQHLTDAELLEFLDYLRVQASPGSAAF